MPLQNRVLATGEIIADTSRGMFMGNRGVLHGDQQVLGDRRWAHKAWVTCVLKHKDWHRNVMTPHRYTELFFLDEAVALAAGHRPCALCRRGDYDRYRDAAGLSGPAKDMDTRLHTERAVPRTYQQRRHLMAMNDIPGGAVVFHKMTAMLALNDALVPISPDGYGRAHAKPRLEHVSVLTPPTSLAALRAGYNPVYHPSLDAF